MSKKTQKNNKKNPYAKMMMLGALCVFGIAVLTFYVCAKMMGDSIYYTLYRRYDKSAAYEDTAHGLILHSRTHKPFTGVIVLENKPTCMVQPNGSSEQIEQSGINKNDTPENTNLKKSVAQKKVKTCSGGDVAKKEIFIKKGQIRGEKIYNTQTGKLCQETFFDFDGHFKYRRSYGSDCSYLETEEIFKKDANVVLFYNAKGQKTVKAFIENDRFTHGFCYEGFGQTIQLNDKQLERLNHWDTTVTCRD